MKITETFIEDFEANNKGAYLAFHIGIVEIDPERIVALNAFVEDIRDSDKMRKLKESVNIKGWTNEDPYTFLILQLPTGDLVVNVGNHRGYLSKELKEKGILTSVKANVYKYVNVEHMPEDVLERLLFIVSYFDENYG